MKEEFLKLMRCPYCNGDLEVNIVLKKRNSHIESGIVGCECSRYPILGGILYIKATPLREYVLKLLEAQKTGEAISLLLGKGIENIYWFTSLLGGSQKNWIKAPIKVWAKCSAGKYLHGDPPFSHLLGKSSSDVYFKHRFSTIWSLYPFMSLMKERAGRVLDLGCGMGHASFMVATQVKPEALVGADYSFRFLYINRKYFAPDAELVCLNADYPLPFKDGIFDCVLMVDAIQYINGLASLTDRIKNVLASQGFLLLSHVRMTLARANAGERALPSRSYINLLQDSDIQVKIFPEQTGITEDFLRDGRVDLTREYSEEELDAAPTVSVLATRERENFKILGGIWDDSLKVKDNLIINPIYHIKREGDRIHLTIKHAIIKVLEHEGHLSEKYLPKHAILGERLSHSITKLGILEMMLLSDVDRQELEQLMRQFVIINVPKKYTI